MRLQNAMEFMMTYGWAILILMVVIATLYSLGVFNANATTASICTLPANVGCVSAILWPNGILQVNIQQATQYTINIIAIGCNDKNIPNNPSMPMANVIPQVTLPIGGNATFTNNALNPIQCYSNYKPYGSPTNVPIGSTYTGYLIVNYTDISTGFTHTVSGTLIQKVK